MSKTDKDKRQFKHKKNLDNALKVLEATISSLDKFNVKYYLDYGTLIGSMREKGFIPWDDDMDLSLVVNHANYKKIPQVLKHIKKLGFRTYLMTFQESIDKRIIAAKKNQEGKVYENNITFTDKNNYRVAKIRNNKIWRFGRGGTTLDIFFKYEKNNDLYWMAQGKVHSIPLETLGTEYIEIDFYHLKCKIPKNYDKYLTSMYGDWKTPKEDWQYYEHETCIAKN